MTDIRMTSRNNEVRVGEILVSTLTFDQPKNKTLTSGEKYLVGTIPAGCVITNVRTLVDESFNGSSPKLDIGITGNDTYFKNDLALGSVGTSAITAGVGRYFQENVDITMKPVISGATKGSVRLIIEYIQPNTRTGSYTA